MDKEQSSSEEAYDQIKRMRILLDDLEKTVINGVDAPCYNREDSIDPPPPPPPPSNRDSQSGGALPKKTPPPPPPGPGPEDFSESNREYRRKKRKGK